MPCWPRRVTGRLTNEVDLGRKFDRKVVVRGQGPFRLQLSLSSRPVPASIEPGPRFDLVPGGGSSARARDRTAANAFCQYNFREPISWSTSALL